MMSGPDDMALVKENMKATFGYRQEMVHNPATTSAVTVLDRFPRFLDTPSLVRRKDIIRFKLTQLQNRKLTDLENMQPCRQLSYMCSHIHLIFIFIFWGLLEWHIGLSLRSPEQLNETKQENM